MNELYVQPVGIVGEQAIAWAEAVAAEWFPFPVRRLPPLEVPPGSYDPARRQHQSVAIMKALARDVPPGAARVLGLTEFDLSIPLLTFLFGQAQLDGPVALVSLCRLRQEFYRLPPDPGLLRERLAKEMLHELGHTFGLTHCPSAECAMSLSTHIEMVDTKRAGWCHACGSRLARRFAPLRGGQA